jgi:hypothetical protein
MLRTPRTASLRLTASLLRSLILGSAFITGTAVVASSLVACADESQPEYWIEKLDDGAWRAKAIERLSQFFEDAMTTSKRDMEAPEVKNLLDKLAGPLTKVYVESYETLDEKTRESLINLLASFRDPRTEPALKKAFEEFGKRGRGGKDVKWAARAVRDMKLKGAAPAVFAAFKKTKPSTKDGAYYRDLNEALLVVANPSWSGDLVNILDTEFPVAAPGKKPSVQQMKDLRDTAYQVITACQILGEMREASAVKPLIKLVLDPTRSEAANEALLALTKIGKPSVDAAIKLLQDKDPELADYYKKKIQKATGAKAPPKGSPHIARAAIILGTLGRSEGIAPMIAAIDAQKEDGEKAELLSALAMLPHTPAVEETFTNALKDIAADTTAGGQNALGSLSEAATLFFDSSMTPMLVDRANDLKDDKVAKSLVALAAIKTMDLSQTRAVKRLIDRLPKEKDGPLVKHMEKISHGYDLAEKVLQTCKKDVACYLKEASKSTNQSDKDQLAGVKALYMVGQLGGPAAAAKLVEIMPDLEKGSLRYVAAQVIDHHYPKGSPEIAKQLQTIVEQNKKSMDKGKAAGDKPLRDALYRLQARAG